MDAPIGLGRHARNTHPLKPKWQTPLPPRVSRKRSGHSICSEADGNSSRSPENPIHRTSIPTLRNCHGFRRVTFRIASHDCTTEKSRDGFSEGKAKARRWSDLPGKSLTTEPLRTSTRTTGPGVPQWATTNSRSRKNKIRPQAKEISAMIRLEKTKKSLFIMKAGLKTAPFLTPPNPEANPLVLP